MEHLAWLLPFLWLIPLGFLVGTFGTLIGAGGGFILVPVLLLIYPHYKPEVITSISLAVVFFNALSGSAAYIRMKRVDFRSGWLFALATIPGSILGAWNVAFIPRRWFDLIFGVLLLAVSIFLFLKPDSKKSLPQQTVKSAGSEITATKAEHGFTRHMIDAEGISYVFTYNRVLGVVLSVGVGYLSSLLGIGGGIIHVPVLVHLLNFPVHIATATSHFVLAIMAFTGSMTHLATGVLQKGIYQTLGLGVGAVIGAQLGAKLSNRFHGRLIIQCLAGALFLVGVRIFFMGLF